MVGTTTKATIPIVFGGGCYGTFVDWCVNYFSGKCGPELPFTQVGNSHAHEGHHLIGMAGWREYLASDVYYPIVRFHPKLHQEESVKANLDEIFSSADRVVAVYAAEDHFVLNLNNKFEKIFEQGWLAYNYPVIRENLAKWNTNELSQWEFREFLSFYIWDQHRSETEPDVIANYADPRLFKIEVGELLDNFETTIRTLLDYCGLAVVRNDFERIYSEWTATQKHLGKDRLVNQIVDAVAKDIEFTWPALTVVDEAIVQMKLKDLLNLELLCYNLDVFPNNTQQLREFLIHV